MRKRKKSDYEDNGIVDDVLMRRSKEETQRRSALDALDGKDNVMLSEEFIRGCTIVEYR